MPQPGIGIAGNMKGRIADDGIIGPVGSKFGHVGPVKPRPGVYNIQLGTFQRIKICFDEIEFGDAYQLDDEFWHAECYAEYFDEVLEPTA